VTKPEPTDEQYQAALWQTCDLADHLLAGVSAGSLWPDVIEGSSMAADNAETEPFQLSHVVQTLLYVAIEHLHATAGLVRKAGLLHNAPPFTLCRTAVETAATAYWILSPNEQKLRLKNHLTYMRQDTFDYEQVSKLIADRFGQPMPDIANRRSWADKIKTKHHITGLGNKLDLNRMIADVDTAIAVQDDRTNDHHIEIYWKTASGFIHGRQWALLNVLVREQVTPLGNATATVKLSSTNSRVLWGAAAAYELINRAWHLYYTACGHDDPNSDIGQPSTS
jgi:hypothetical protein